MTVPLMQAILDCCPMAASFKDSKGRTALHYTCAEGSADCVRVLLACKRSVRFTRSDQ